MSYRMVPVYCLTNERHYWLLPGFAHLFTTYWPGQPVTVAGYGPPDFELPRGWDFWSIADDNWPAQRWSDGLINLAASIPQDRFVLMLEDYWLTAPVDIKAVAALQRWMGMQSTVLRCDLWGERAAKKQARPFGKVGDVELVYTPPWTKYQMSLQAAIWDRDLLLEVLQPNETPWQTEINGTKRLAQRPDLLVTGVKERVVHYWPVYRTGRGKFDTSKIPGKQVGIMRERGWLTH